MSISVAEAAANLQNEYRFWAEPDLCGGLPESCTPVNDASRALINAMVAASPNGEVWLARINCCDNDQQCMRPYRGPAKLHPDTVAARHAEYLANPDNAYFKKCVTTEVGIVYNFEFAFVLAEYDAELHRLLQDYRFKSTLQTSMEYINRVFDRAEAIGARYLHWS